MWWLFSRMMGISTNCRIVFVGMLILSAVAIVNSSDSPRRDLASSRASHFSCQNSPVRPTLERTFCPSSSDRGLHAGLRGSLYHAFASAHTVAAGTIIPPERRLCSNQRFTCSSDRKSEIVAQVNPMSSYQRAAGT